jgi:hypothetical protein
VLVDPAQAEQAMSLLNHAPLFNGILELGVVLDTLPEVPYVWGHNRGWYASKNPSIWQAKLREPLWTPPKDLFAPLRESRRVVIENMPHFEWREATPYRYLYRLLHSFDVLCCSGLARYIPKSGNISGCFMKVDFATKQDADIAIDSFDQTIICDHTTLWSVSKLPLKYSESWDKNTSLHRKLGHNKSGRDEGSAVDTNWETVSAFTYNVSCFYQM